jgi:hypothetical protein
MKKFLLIFLFLIITPINLGVSLSLLSKSSFLQTVPAQASSQLYAALPQTIGQVLGTFETDDARPIIIGKYLEKYQSPMAPHADLIVEVSDKYGLDWRLLVAIAQQESNLGKKAPSNSYNAWGWGVHSRGTLRFSNWEQGIETVAKGIKEKYIDKGYTTPEEIMSKYTPLSSGSWAFGVNQFIQELETGQVE